MQTVVCTKSVLDEGGVTRKCGLSLVQNLTRATNTDNPNRPYLKCPAHGFHSWVGAPQAAAQSVHTAPMPIMMGGGFVPASALASGYEQRISALEARVTALENISPTQPPE